MSTNRIGTGVASRPLNGAGGGLWFCGEGSSLARGRRGCSEVGGETLVALQVGKGVKLAPLRKGVQTL